MNNKTNNLSVSSKDNFSIQTGTIPVGVTSSGSKYPVNASDASIQGPNDSPFYEPFIQIHRLHRDFSIELTRDWTSKITTGDPLQVIRGNIRSEYNVQYARYSIADDVTTIKLSHTRGVVDLLDPFIGAGGYPYAADDSYVTLDRRVENPNIKTDNVNSFGVKMIANQSSMFNVKAEWDVDPSVSAIKLRWRSVPRNSSISELSFSVYSGGLYSEIPEATIVSDTGRNAKLTLSGTIDSIQVTSGGSGYTSAYATLKDYNIGATFSVSVAGGSVTGVTPSGFFCYPVKPQIEIHGNPGSTGAAAEVVSMQVVAINTVQQGTNYLSNPTVYIDPTYQLGYFPTSVSASLTLSNAGKIDYVTVTNGGYGYTGASISIGGGYPFASVSPTIENGSITDMEVIYSGNNYITPNVVILPIGTGGDGAQATANVDIYSQWVYVDVNIQDNFAILTGFKYNIPYEMEILASDDLYFKSLNKYTNNTHFQYYK